jgi:hypothetical protein
MNESISIENFVPRLDKALGLQLEGWKNLEIEYSIELYEVSTLFWRVKGTQHVFKIPFQTVYERHELDLAAHFTLTLKVFREDYLGWKSQGFPQEWSHKYRDQFETLIDE